MEPLTRDDPAEIGGYRLRARLGAGGMGRVYLASTPGGRPVALKVVRPELGDDADFRARFRQEIEAAQRVRGLYTAELLNADPAATPPWLVTAYVPGPSLQQAVADHGPMPQETVILLMAGVAEALQAIHSAGVVHRDLKPSNVLLAPDGPRVIDFGIARAAEATNLTQSGMAVGSPQFMAPEQIRGLAITPAIDVFALGAVAAFALLGRPPFGEGQVAALMYRVLNEPARLTGCSGALRTLIERCLAKEPADRPAPAEIIESCRSLSSGNLDGFTDSWLPPAVAAAARAPAAVRAPASAGGPGSPSPQPNGSVNGTNGVTGSNGATGGANRATQAPGSPPRGSARPPFPGPANGTPGRSAPPVMTPPGDATAGRPRPAGPTGPGAPYQPAGPSWRPPVPSSLTTAAKLMNAGAAVCALGAIVGLGTVPELKTIIAQQHPAAPHAVGAAIAILLLHGLIGTALWLWLAGETRRGLRRARAWATVIFVIATVSGISIDANAPSTGLTQAVSGVDWVIGLCAIVLLWNRPSRAYYNALPSQPPAPPPFRPSPSLRPRQVPPAGPGSTRRDWQARPPGQPSGSRPSQADRPGQRR
jgi:serine/threonine kinase PknH